MGLLREKARSRAQGKPPCCVVFVFSFVSLALVCGCTTWPQPGALGGDVKCLGCHGTDDWSDDADISPLRTTHEGVACRLEMHRQLDEISAVQCRKRKLAETSYSAKSATSKEATARLQSTKCRPRNTCRCLQCPRYVVDQTVVQKHVGAYRG